VLALGAAFPSNNYSKKDRSHQLEMYPVWLRIDYLSGGGIASVSVEEKVSKLTK
jgi:hypothetical protein